MKDFELIEEEKEKPAPVMEPPWKTGKMYRGLRASCARKTIDTSENALIPLRESEKSKSVVFGTKKPKNPNDLKMVNNVVAALLTACKNKRLYIFAFTNVSESVILRNNHYAFDKKYWFPLLKSILAV